tara:strand:- start:1211 stop:1564 length:354 start_codon:yes stop_codon:yes gene_type:complete
MFDFNSFVKLMRERKEYDNVIAQKPDELKLKEWMAVLFIRNLIDDGFKVYQIIKIIPKEYRWLLREFIVTTIAPKRLWVNWSHLKSSLARVPPVKQETISYIQAHQPVRYFATSIVV